VLIAAASWKWIEEPFRKPFPARATLPLGLAAAATVAAIAFGVVAANGFPGRIDPRLAALTSFKAMWDWNCPHAARPLDIDCAVGADWDSAAAKGVIWGDSHAEHLLPLLDLAGRGSGRAIALFGDCPPIYYDGGLRRVIAGYPSYDAECTAQRARYLGLLRSSPELEFVFVASRWSAYLADTYRNEGDARSVARGLDLLKEALGEFVAEIAPLGRTTVLLGEVPQLGFDPIPCVILEHVKEERVRLWRDDREVARCEAMTASIPRASVLQRLSATNEVLRSIAAKNAGVLAFFPTEKMCKPDCITSVRDEFLYRDGNHLRRNLSAPALEELVTLFGLRGLLQGLGGHAGEQGILRRAPKDRG
jgi:hypothetical protein